MGCLKAQSMDFIYLILCCEKSYTFKFKLIKIFYASAMVGVNAGLTTKFKFKYKIFLKDLIHISVHYRVIKNTVFKIK